jgi:hypothetical protein
MRERVLVVLRVVFLRVCPDGCYRHYVKGMGWVCCKCGD